MQHKKYLQPKIALLNIELELKAERENAEIRLDNVAVSRWIVLFFNIILLFHHRNIKRLSMLNGQFFTIN